MQGNGSEDCAKKQQGLANQSWWILSSISDVVAHPPNLNSYIKKVTLKSFIFTELIIINILSLDKLAGFIDKAMSWSDSSNHIILQSFINFWSNYRVQISKIYLYDVKFIVASLKMNFFTENAGL